MYLLLLLCFFIYPHYALPIDHVITITAENDLERELAGVPSSFFLTTVSCQADVSINRQEFLYLIDMPEQSVVTGEQLRRAIKHLQKKNKFKTITVSFEQDGAGKKVHWQLTSFWTLKRLVLHGLAMGKESWRTYYTIAPGDHFDEKKHLSSLERMHEAYAQKGYFACHIVPHIVYDYTYKMVTVHLTLKKEKMYHIGALTVRLSGDDLTGDDTLYVRHAIEKLLRPLTHTPYSKERLNEEVKNIKQFLAERGFLYSTINLQESINHTAHAVDLSLHLQLSKKKELIFCGNCFFSHEQLLALLLRFGNAAYLIPASIIQEEIVQLYKSKGFWDVAIEVQEDDHEILFLIQEGRRSVIDHVEIQQQSFDAKMLAKKFFPRTRKPFPVDDEIIEQCCHDLLLFFGRHGFVAATIVKQEFKKTELPDRYSLAITINEGERLCAPLAEAGAVTQTEEHTKFGKTILAGQSRLPFSMIMRELAYKEGDVWDKKKLQESMLALKRLNIFDGIYFRPLIVSQQDEIPIVLKLHDDDPFELRTRVGFGLQQVAQEVKFGGYTYKVGASLLYKNPFNNADQIRFDADILRSEKSVVLQYSRPWIFNMPIQTMVQVYSSMYLQPGFMNARRSLYDVIQQGFLINLAREYGALTASTNIGIEWMKTAISQNQEKDMFAARVARAINFEPRLINNKVPYLLIEPTCVIDTLDNPLNPCRGSLTVVSLKGMLPVTRQFEDISFLKCLIEQSFFIPCRFFVFALRVRFGHIFHRYFSDIMPSERFYLGGANSVRSYQTDLCPPLGELDDCGKKKFVPQGAKSMANMNIEARCPVFKNVSIVLFQDFGFLSNNLLTDIAVHNVLSGTGFGVRYDTPIGPVRFDVGFRWGLREPRYISGAWFVTFGHAF